MLVYFRRDWSEHPPDQAVTGNCGVLIPGEMQVSCFSDKEDEILISRH